MFLLFICLSTGALAQFHLSPKSEWNAQIKNQEDSKVNKKDLLNKINVMLKQISDASTNQKEIEFIKILQKKMNDQFDPASIKTSTFELNKWYRLIRVSKFAADRLTAMQTKEVQEKLTELEKKALEGGHFKVMFYILCNSIDICVYEWLGLESDSLSELVEGKIDPKDVLKKTLRDLI